MRQKEWKLVITFRTTADAIAFEKACKASGGPGRMIPVPREISAGCGLAWATLPDEKDGMYQLLTEQNITCEEMKVLYC